MRAMHVLAGCLFLVSALCGLAGDDAERVVLRAGGHGFTERELHSWYTRMADTYAVVAGELRAIDETELERIEGEILQVAGEQLVLVVDVERGTVALRVPDAGRVVDGERVRCLGMRCGRYRYVNVLGSECTVRLYAWQPRMSYDWFLRRLRRHGLFREMEVALADRPETQRSSTIRRVRSAKPLRVWDGSGRVKREVGIK